MRPQVEREADTFAALSDILSLLRALSERNGDIVTAIAELRSDLRSFSPKISTQRGETYFSDDQDDQSPRKIRRIYQSQLEDVFVASTLPLNWPKSLTIRKYEDKLNCHGSVTRQGRRADGLDTTLTTNSSAEIYSRSKAKMRSELAVEGEQRPIGAVSSIFVEREISAQIVARFSGVIEGRFQRNVALEPSSLRHQFYEMLGFVMLLADVLLIPYIVAFQDSVPVHILYYDFTSVIYWSLHFILCFSTGYYSQSGEVVMRASKVYVHYFKTWFALDAIILGLDWWSMYLNFTSTLTTMSRVASLVTLLRSGRIREIFRGATTFLTTIRFVREGEEFIRRTVSESMLLHANKVRILITYLFASHLMCCVWGGIGKFAPADTGSRWPESVTVGLGIDSSQFLTTDITYQYITCFLWAVGQITLAGSDIVPQNSYERVYCVACVMIGLIFGSTTVSLLSAGMVEYQMLKKDNIQKLRMLRQYLRENSVNQNIVVKVTKQARQSLSTRERLGEQDVAVLASLSSQVLRELRFVIRRPHLDTHALFRLWVNLDVNLFKQACFHVVDVEILTEKNDVFLVGHLATMVYYLISGKVSYVQEAETSPVSEDVTAYVFPGQWISEPALWSMWTHVGTAGTVKASSILKVRSEELIEEIKRNVVIFDIAREYCSLFHRRLINAKPPASQYPNDLTVPYTDYCDILLAMQKHLQIIVGLDAFSQLSRSVNYVNHKGFSRLRDEVEAGEAALLVTGEGDVVRVAGVVAIEVKRAGGDRFVQIGKRERDRLTPICLLPGGKIERNELTSEAADRIVSTKLPLLEFKVHQCASKRTVAERDSKEYGVKTRYIRTTFYMELLDGEELSAPICGTKHRATAEVSNDRRESLLSPSSSTSPYRTVETSLRNKEVICVFKQDNILYEDVTLYAWLSIDDFEFLSSAEGEQELKSWVDALEIPGMVSEPCVDSEQQDEYFVDTLATNLTLLSDTGHSFTRGVSGPPIDSMSSASSSSLVGTDSLARVVEV